MSMVITPVLKLTGHHISTSVADGFRRCLLFSVFILTAALYGCATAPIQEMSDARQTVEAARDAGAETEVPGSLKQAEALLIEAQRQLERNSFTQARSNAVSARVQAEEARMLADIVSETRRAITDKSDDDADTRKANELLEQAVGLAGRGDLTTALQLAREARQLAIPTR